MTEKVTLTISVEPTVAMQILALLAGDGIPTTVVNNSGENGPEPTVDEQAADELAEQEAAEAAEAEAKKKADAAAKRKAAREEKKRLEQEAAEKAAEEAEEAEEEESEEADEEQVEEEQVDNEEPEADAEEDKEPEAVEYTLDDIRAALGAFMKTFKTQAAGKKQLGLILSELPTPAKCLSDVEESEYGVLMAAINGDDDPLA